MDTSENTIADGGSRCLNTATFITIGLMQQMMNHDRNELDNNIGHLEELQQLRSMSRKNGGFAGCRRSTGVDEMS